MGPRGMSIIGATMLAAGFVLSPTASLADARVADLVHAGAIRIGVFPSFQYSTDPVTGRPRGLAVGIGQALAKRLGLDDVITVALPSPPKVIECVKTGACDFGFMLIDPARAEEVDFTSAFVRSDFTYLVPANSPIRSAAEVDRVGVRVAAVRGHASTMVWLRTATRATPVHAESYEEAIDLLRSGKAQAFASIREMLLEYSPKLAGSRVLSDSYQSNFAGIAVAKGRADRLGFLNDALDDMKHSGFLRELIQKAGLRGIEVVDSSHLTPGK